MRPTSGQALFNHSELPISFPVPHSLSKDPRYLKKPLNKGVLNLPQGLSIEFEGLKKMDIKKLNLYFTLTCNLNDIPFNYKYRL